jgi:hypothetical protein
MGKVLEVPAGTYHVGPLSAPSNLSLVLDSGAVVQANAGFSDYQMLFVIDHVSNVSITGPGGFQGNRGQQAAGEYRHCMGVVGATHVTLKDFFCNGSAGDGIYISGNSADIDIEGVTLDNNRRNGLTLISANGLRVKNCQMTNTNGAPAGPWDGIDVEPNDASDGLADIVFSGNTTSGNAGSGVAVVTYAEAATSPSVSITISNHTDSNEGLHGFLFNGSDFPYVGNILLQNSSTTRAQEFGIYVEYWQAYDAHIGISNVSVKDANLSGTTLDNVAVTLKRGGGESVPEGNVSFSGISIIDTVGRLDYYWEMADFSNVGLQNVQFLEPGTLSGARFSGGLVNGNPVGATYSQ